MKLIVSFALSIDKQMDKLFEVIFLDEAFEFLENLEKSHYEKILKKQNRIKNENLHIRRSSG